MNTATYAKDVLRNEYDGTRLSRWAGAKIVAFLLGLIVLGLPIVSFAQAVPDSASTTLLPPPPPPPPSVQQSPSSTTVLPPPPPPPPLSAQPTNTAPNAQPEKLPSRSRGEAKPPIPPSFNGVRPNASALSSLPAVLPYTENSPIPPNYKIQLRVRRGLVIPGAILSGVFYGVSFLGGVFLDDIGNTQDGKIAGLLFIPGVGPFIMAGVGTNDAVAGVALGLGIAQMGSTAMLIGGILAKKKWLVREDIAKVMRPEVFVGPGSIHVKISF